MSDKKDQPKASSDVKEMPEHELEKVAGRNKFV